MGNGSPSAKPSTSHNYAGAVAQTSHSKVSGQEEKVYRDHGALPADRTAGCPYHGPILRMDHSARGHGSGLDPMSRFLHEGHSEQSALFIRPDTDQPSTSRGCACPHGESCNPLVLTSPCRFLLIDIEVTMPGLTGGK